MSTQTPTTYAALLDDFAQRPLDTFRGSSLGHQESLEELYDVWEECQTPGWDGYDALAVEQDTYSAAYQLIDSLPLGFPKPAIGAEPDGQLTLEWRKSQSRLLSVSVDPDGFLHFAGIFGTDKHYGTLGFYSSPPQKLIQLVQGL